MLSLVLAVHACVPTARVFAGMMTLTVPAAFGAAVRVLVYVPGATAATVKLVVRLWPASASFAVTWRAIGWVPSIAVGLATSVEQLRTGLV